MKEFRVRSEKDSFGEIEVPFDRLWGAQTQRSLERFSISNEKIDREIIKAIILIKKAAAETHLHMNLLAGDIGYAIVTAADELLTDLDLSEFPLSVWQSGSGTQTNMNVNEVLANLASEILGGERGERRLVHPNDDVNKSQSSNDVFPSAMHISAMTGLVYGLLPALRELKATFEIKSNDFMFITKIGRTHLMDATPITLGQEFSGFVSQLAHSIIHIENTLTHLKELAIGGTAVGTGLNAPLGFSEMMVARISKYTGLEFFSASNKFESMATHDALVQSHGALKALAISLFKISSDIRWLGSGPRTGLGEIILPENEPGSSIMPGKVNRTQCEAMAMLCTQVLGNDVTINFAGASGNFELNVFKPVIIHNFLQSIRILTDGCLSFERSCVRGITPDKERIAQNLDRSLMLVTALVPHLGYDKAAIIAKKAYEEGKSLKQAALETELVSEEDFDRWVKAQEMTMVQQFTAFN
jgi:fumarate hydratase class II